jgi:hypothetical protein
MSMHSRTLDRAGRLADELVVDALFIVRRKPWHWPVVAVGLVTGFAAGWAATGSPGFVAFAFAFVSAGLGMNIGSDFRFIARSPTRVLLYESSRVIGLPTELVRSLDPAAVHCSPAGPALHLAIDGERHVMARQHATRLQRMLATTPAHLLTTERQP